MDHVACKHCDRLITSGSKTLFSGLRQVTCPDCGLTMYLPMRTWIRVAYVAWVGMGVCMAGKQLWQGKVPMAGFVLLFVPLLGWDLRVRRWHASDARMPGPPPDQP